MNNYYITNGIEIIPCNSLQDACAQATLQDWQDEQDGLWKVRRA